MKELLWDLDVYIRENILASKRILTLNVPDQSALALEYDDCISSEG